MTMLRLHNNDDPTRTVLIKSDDISTVIPCVNGSAISSSDGATVFVHETLEELDEILRNLEGR